MESRTGFDEIGMGCWLIGEMYGESVFLITGQGIQRNVDGFLRICWLSLGFSHVLLRFGQSSRRIEASLKSSRQSRRTNGYQLRKRHIETHSKSDMKQLKLVTRENKNVLRTMRFVKSLSSIGRRVTVNPFSIHPISTLSLSSQIIPQSLSGAMIERPG